MKKVEPFFNAKLNGWSNRSLLETITTANSLEVKILQQIKSISIVTLAVVSAAAGALMYDRSKQKTTENKED